MKIKREEEAAKPKLTELKKPEEKNLKKAIEEGEVKELPDACPACQKKTLLTDGDTIWCMECDYEWFI
jgi:ribosomal protein L37AE/L43A